MTPPNSTLNVGRSTLDVPPLISFPARPTNGGRLEDAPPKVGPWVYQPKIDDWRAIVHTPTKRIWNRHGQPLTIESDLATALMILSGHRFEWLDVGVMERRNQLLRGSIVVFDWIDGIGASYEARRKILKHEFQPLPVATVIPGLGIKNTRERVFLINDTTVTATRQPFPTTTALDLYTFYQAENERAGSNFYEGLVAKRTDKPYPIQLLDPKKETPWMMKHRFDQ